MTRGSAVEIGELLNQIEERAAGRRGPSDPAELIAGLQRVLRMIHNNLEDFDDFRFRDGVQTTSDPQWWCNRLIEIAKKIAEILDGHWSLTISSQGIEIQFGQPRFAL